MFFSRMINLVSYYGGDVYKFAVRYKRTPPADARAWAPVLLAWSQNAFFAHSISPPSSWQIGRLRFLFCCFVRSQGDALIIIWSHGTDDDVVNAVRCGFALKDFTFDVISVSKVVKQVFVGELAALIKPLTLHCGLGSGACSFAVLGGVNKHWEFIVDGICLTQMSLAEAQAGSSELVVSGDVWDRYNQIVLLRGRQDGDGDGVHAPQQLRGRKLDGGGSFFSANYCVDELEAGYEHADARPAANHRLQILQTVPEDTLELQCGKFIPRSALGMLNAQYRQQIASTRPVTVCFMNIIESNSPAISPALSDESDHRPLLRLQTVFAAMQKVLVREDAMLRQFLVDDKGIVLIAVLGTHSHGHSDDPFRATTVANDCYSILLQHNFQASIGITTGQALCGTVGSTSRTEYAVVGSVVNLAAKIMVRAGEREISAHWCVCCVRSRAGGGGRG